jgi:DNA-binding response OmpR family regulator
MRILIAEDDEALARYVRQGLEAESYQVGLAVEGEQACVMAETSNWDLAILDLNLPRLDGMSVLRRLRAKRPGLPVLILTQRSQVEDRVECLETGADDFLAKPFSFRELSARIRALLRRSHEPSAAVLKVADLVLDRMARRAERAGRPIELTVREFAWPPFQSPIQLTCPL